MFSIKRVLGGTLFVFMVAGTTLAQESRAPVVTPGQPVPAAPQERVPAAPLVAATATAKRVRFVSPGAVVQLRLEVFNESGQKLFDTEQRGGNVLDWPLQDGAGEPLPTGSYACVLTIKSLSGRLSQRVGLVTVDDKKASIETAAAPQLSMAQQQAIGPVAGPVEGNAAFTVLQQNEAEAITAVTHDGADGQVTSTAGALTFRTGDLFSGKDKEQMRLTADGRLGIGTSDPQAKLDVAGMIRAERVVIAKPGKPGSAKLSDSVQATNDEQPLASGSGTQDRIAKWTDNAGTLGDSVITETPTGNVGVGTTNPQSLLQVGAHPGYGATTGLLITNNLTGSQYDRGFQLAPRQTASPLTNSILIYALPTVSPGVTVPSQYGFFVDGRQGAGSISSYAAIATGQNPSLGASNNTHLLMGSLAIPPGNFAIYDNTNFNSYFKGNVGIGMNNPAAKLDVAGHINTNTQFNIGGHRVFSVPGLSSTYAGYRAGNSGAGGTNSFFGYKAGENNNANSNFNSFFGAQAGQGFASPVAGEGNAYFGYATGSHSTTGNGNAFFGARTGTATGSGSYNTFLGSETGQANTDGSHNTYVGHKANGTASLTNAGAVGALASVTQSDSLVLGSISGENGATESTKVGIGTTAPTERLEVVGNLKVSDDLRVHGSTLHVNAANERVTIGPMILPLSLPFAPNSIFFANDGGHFANSLRIDGYNNNLHLVAHAPASALAPEGAGIIFSTGPPAGGENERVVITPAGTVKIHVLGTDGATTLCRNAANEISTCTTPSLTAVDAGVNAALFETVKKQQQQLEAQRAQIERLAAKLAELEQLAVETATNAKSKP